MKRSTAKTVSDYPYGFETTKIVCRKDMHTFFAYFCSPLPSPQSISSKEIQNGLDLGEKEGLQTATSGGYGGITNKFSPVG